jgi:hypothetical protein
MTHDAGTWIRDELEDAWRAAQEQAALAYAHWSATGGRAAYAVYRAAEDRADAAQDAVAARSLQPSAPCGERA